MHIIKSQKLSSLILTLLLWTTLFNNFFALDQYTVFKSPTAVQCPTQKLKIQSQEVCKKIASLFQAIVTEYSYLILFIGMLISFFFRSIHFSSSYISSIFKPPKLISVIAI